MKPLSLQQEQLLNEHIRTIYFTRNGWDVVKVLDPLFNYSEGTVKIIIDPNQRWRSNSRYRRSIEEWLDWDKLSYSYSNKIYTLDINDLCRVSNAWRVFTNNFAFKAPVKAHDTNDVYNVTIQLKDLRYRQITENRLTGEFKYWLSSDQYEIDVFIYTKNVEITTIEIGSPSSYNKEELTKIVRSDRTADLLKSFDNIKDNIQDNMPMATLNIPE